MNITGIIAEYNIFHNGHKHQIDEIKKHSDAVIAVMSGSFVQRGPQGAWYTQDAAKAVYAGLLDNSDAGQLDQSISRKDAFILFDKAFQIAEAQPDLTVLDQFPDAASLTGQSQRAAAALVEAGIVSGNG